MFFLSSTTAVFCTMFYFCKIQTQMIMAWIIQQGSQLSYLSSLQEPPVAK